MSGDELSPGESRAIRGCDSLLRAAGAWLTAADVEERRVRAALGRALGGSLATGFVGGVAVNLGPYAWSASGVVLALSVWVAGRPAADVDDEDIDSMDPGEFLELVHDVSAGGNVHLVEIRRQLALETDREWSGPQVRALCDAAGIPVRDGVRVRGAKPAVTTGIHRDDLPPLPRPSSEGAVGVVGAGQESNNNTNITTEAIGQAGLLIKHGPSIRQEARS
jgi:hypothetical protein